MVIMCMECSKLIEDHHFSLEYNYRDIYYIMKLIPIVVVIFYYLVFMHTCIAKYAIL